jgi:hypothetical protein
VNEQYITPITHFHGMMSWALMRNPAGLDCDMFISHAWLEGIFEFLRKVLHSWPRGQGLLKDKDVICWGLENQQLKHQGHAN